MKNVYTIVAMTAAIWLTSCATLDIAELNRLNQTKFDALQLTPATEPNELRVDVIRQIQSTGDSTAQTKLVPYHPLGFDLGNGLFFDVNQNLSFRIDQLLKFKNDHAFEIRHIARPQNNKGVTVYAMRNDSLTVYPPNGRPRYYYHAVGSADSLSFLHRNRFMYNIVDSDSSLAYGNRRRFSNIIFQVDDDSYRLQRGRRRQYDYRLNDNSVFLEDDYIISLSDDQKRLEVLHVGARRTRLLYTAVRGENKIFFYDKHNRGTKIEFKDAGVDVFVNHTPQARYELADQMARNGD